MQVSPHIDEYSIEHNFTWKKFPCEENKLSILIIYDDNTHTEMAKLVNKLLLIFPEKFYYDDEKNNWIKLPLNSNGYRVPHLDKIVNIPLVDNGKCVLIINNDNLLLEDSKNYESYQLPTIIEKEKDLIPHLILDNLDKNTKIFKILDNRTFISHVICVANIKNIEKSYYEKFDIIFFTTVDIANTFTCTRTYRQFGVEKMIPDKVFMTDLREMKNNVCLFNI